MEYQIQRYCNFLGNPVDVIKLDEPLDVEALDVQKSFKETPRDVIVPVRLGEISLRTNMVLCGAPDGLKWMPETLVIYSGEVKGEQRALGSDYMICGAPHSVTRHDGIEQQIPEFHDDVLAQIRKFLREPYAQCDFIYV